MIKGKTRHIVNVVLATLIVVIFIAESAIGWWTSNDQATRSMSLMDIKSVAEEYSSPLSLSSNPERGFYNTSNLVLNENGKVAGFTATQSTVSKLLFLKVDLSAFSGAMNVSGEDKRLTGNAMQALKTTLNEIKENDNTVILRFVYDNAATGVIEGKSKIEPGQDMLLDHITALGDTFKEYANTIDVIQVGFYGLWGECYYNTDATDHPEYYRDTISKLLTATAGTNITIAVRTPEYYSWARGIDIANISYDAVSDSDEMRRVCIFNDANGASADDLGTYKNRKNEVAWIGRQAEGSFYGGEAIVDSGYDGSNLTAVVGVYNNGAYFIDEARTAHTTYLNYEWNQLLHNRWKEIEYRDTTAYKYIENHLGYRLSLPTFSVEGNPTAGSTLTCNFEIQNDGFAPVIKPKVAEIVFVDSAGNEAAAQIVDFDVTKIMPGTKVAKTIACEFPAGLARGVYSLGLRLYSGDKLDNGIAYSSIQMANEGMWLAQAKANKLTEIEVTDGKSTFAVLNTDKSLRFYRNEDTIPTVGQVYKGRTVDAVYTGFSKGYASQKASQAPWASRMSDISEVIVEDEGITAEATCYWFNNASNLTFVNMQKFDFSQTTDMESMFNACTGLTELRLCGWNTSKVTNMSGMFARCNNLTTIYADKYWSVASVTNSANMFCSWAEKLIGGYGTKYVANVGRGSEMAVIDKEGQAGYFTYWCTPGYDHVPATTATVRYCVNDGWEWCSNCDVLGYSACPECGVGSNTFGSRVENGFYSVQFAVYSQPEERLTFYNREFVPAENETYDGRVVTKVYKLKNTNNLSWKTDSSRAIRTIEFKDKVTPSDVGYWFSSLGSLTTVLQANNLDLSLVTNMTYMFYYCSKLSTIEGLETWDVSKVADISYIFTNCKSLTSLDLSGWDTSNVFTMERAITGCSSLTSLDLSGWDTSNVTNMNGIFSGCSSLTSLDLSGWDTGKVTNMSGMFWFCSRLTHIWVSAGWNTGNTSSSTDMFRMCSRLPNFNSAVVDKTNAHYNTGGYLTYKHS